MQTHHFKKCSWRNAGTGLAFAITVITLGIGLSLASSMPAEAHHQRRSTDNISGLSIPNLTHGQLHIIARYRSAILDLANRQVQPSVEARTLQNFTNLQFAYCLWGFVPGSLSDEANPFNGCSHAYLAASKALLDRLRQTAETRTKADALADEINTAMVGDAIALEICGNSFEPFNTAQIVMPEWANISFNPLAIVLGFFLFAVSAGILIISRSGQGASRVDLSFIGARLFCSLRRDPGID